MDFFFYEFLTNRYHRSFVEMHFGFCNLIHKDPFFGAAMKQSKLDAPCPYPPLTYISVEHPNVTFNHPDYIPYANLTSRRYGRANPIYYVGFHFVTKVPFDNNIRVDFFFYEFLTNRYHRSFVEMHFGFCNLIHKDPFFGAAMKQGKLDAPCPYPPGEYNLVNMTVLPEAIPRGFPFTKGRIAVNITYLPKKVHIGRGYIDMEIRSIKIHHREKNKKL